MLRVTRRFEDGDIRGYVLDVGPTFFVLALVSDQIRFDGYECLRLEDVLELRVDRYAKFAEAALAARRDVKPAQSPVDVSSLETLVRTAATRFPLVTLHKEEVDAEICWIGAIVHVDDFLITLQAIGPNATWDAQPEEHELADITRVSLGGDYEAALALVGGAPPPLTRTRSVH